MKVELVKQLLILRPAALAAVALTFLIFLVILLVLRRLKVQGRQTKCAGIFVGLSGRSLLLFSTAWMKFAFLVCVLLLAQPAQPVHYLLLLCLICFMPVVKCSWSILLTEVLGGGLLMAGVAVCATLLDYLRQIRHESSILIAYWLLAIFLILGATAVLLREIPEISRERNYFDEMGEIE